MVRKTIINLLGQICLSAVCGFTLATSLYSCVNEVSRDDTYSDLVTHEFNASFAEEGSKTSLGSDGKVLWKSGDVIRYYSEPSGAIREIVVSNDGTSTHLSLTTNPGIGFVAAAYGAQSLTSQSTSSVDLNGIVKPEQSGCFDDAHVSIAYTNDIASERLSFYNLTSLISFSLQRNDVAYVLFKPATSVPSGSAKVPFSGGRPDISNVVPTGNNVSAIKVSTSSGAGEYYISMFPGTISGGFEMEF